MEKVESLPPANSHFQISANVRFQIWAFFLEFSASTARLLDSFSVSVVLGIGIIYSSGNGMEQSPRQMKLFQIQIS